MCPICCCGSADERLGSLLCWVLCVQENEIAEQEKLAGFDLAPVQEVFKSDQVTSAKQRLGEWMTRNKIEVGVHVR